MISWAGAVIVVAICCVAIVALLKRGSLTVDLRQMHAAVRSVEEAVGPKREANVQEVLNEVQGAIRNILRFEQYQHRRNHELMNRLTNVTLGIPVALEMLTEIQESLARISVQLAGVQGPLPPQTPHE